MVTQSDERLRQMLEWSPNAMVMVGSTGLIEMVNSETERIFGYSRDELLGKPIEKLLPERYRGNHRGLRTSFFAAPVSRPMGAGRDLHGLRKDTREFPVEIGLKPIETDEGTMVLSVIVDISERKAQEERIHTATRMLAHMNRVATVGEFSASIAHEVNQPLAAMIANANAGLRWLERATPNLDEARAALKRIVDDGQRAGEVIANLRAMFRKDSVEKSTLDLNDLIEDFLGLARRELEVQGILVQTGLTRPLPLVLGNYNQLQQVISNLVRNAADAMESVSGRPRVLRVNTAVQGSDLVLVTVKDSGTGIDPKDINSIFDSFFTTKSQGMGMGLSISRSVVEGHGGRLWASSGGGHGSTINVQLPVFRPPIE